MTVKVYNEKPYEIQCSAVLQNVQEYEGKPCVVTDQTIFFPEGGGQVGDTGTLSVDNIVFQVIDTQEVEGEIFHILQVTEKEKKDAFHKLQKGAVVELKINWERRFSNMQQHTGEHILSGIAHTLYGIENVGFQLTEEIVRIDFDQQLSKSQLQDLEQRANQAIIENVPTKVVIYQKEEAKQITYRSKKELDSDIRIVTIPGYDCCACCTPHVRSTGEVGMLKIIHSENYKGGMRLNILCGYRLLSYMNMLLEQGKAISNMLSVQMEGLSHGVQQLKNVNIQQKEELVQNQRAFVKLKAKEVKEGTVDYIEFVDGLEGIVFREYANYVVEKIKGVAYLFRENEKSCYQYIIASNQVDVREIGKVLNTSLEGKGGGSNKMVQGTLKGTKQEILGFIQ